MAKAKREHAFNTVAVYGLLERDEHYLFLQRQNTGYQAGMYGLPAGRLERGETLVDAVVRELTEEIGVVAVSDSLRLVHLAHRAGDSYVDVFFAVDSWEGEPTNMEPDKCSDLSWHHKNGLPEKIIPFIGLVIRDIEAGNNFSQYEVEP